MLEHIWLAVLATVGGTIGSIVGLGGGIIVVPVLMLAGFSPSMAASTSLYAVVGNAVASTASYRLQHRVDWRAGIVLGALSVPGTILGAALSVEAAPSEFRALFAVVLIACGAYMIKRRGILRPRPDQGNRLLSGGLVLVVLVVGASFFGGIVSSFFGVGGGVVFVPLMVVAMSMSARRAAPTAQLVLLFASISGVGAHAVFGGAPDMAVALLMLAGGAGGGIAGAQISARIGERCLGALVATVLFAAAAWMAIGIGIP